MTAESLFAECIIPGCKQPVTDELTPCQTCRTIFGPMLQESDRPPSYTAADLAERDAGTAAAYRMMRALPPRPSTTTWTPSENAAQPNTKKPQRRNAAKPKKPTRPAGSAKNDEPAFSAPKGGNADSAARSADTRPEPDAPHGPGSGRRHIRHTPTRSATTARPAENRTRRSGCAAQTPPPTTSRRESQRPPVHERHR